ncbi:hypothetical protein OS493_012488 [Desmophyllum pertusum]|uniref:Uncharacterized protein n=1 Tax=Desmophyllum pertusum TaxID=174260 RepID=A0A9X0D573_9CNID|nr:hypothetical protein OS493_012488 [Desmophyllum pertusum]
MSTDLSSRDPSVLEDCWLSFVDNVWSGSLCCSVYWCRVHRSRLKLRYRPQSQYQRTKSCEQHYDTQGCGLAKGSSKANPKDSDLSGSFISKLTVPHKQAPLLLILTWKTQRE